MAVLDVPLLRPRAHVRAALPDAVRGAAAATLLVGGWLTAVIVARHVHLSTTAHNVALFGHLAALLCGFGAVLAIDWFGLLWATGRRPFTEVVRTATALHTLIWVGLAGLVATGALLQPDTTSAQSRVKLALVLVIGVNGLYAHLLQAELRSVRLAAFAADRAPWTAAPTSLLARAAATATVSQLCWWTTIVIGFAHTRR
jgi:hypothetical protein